MKSIDNIQQLVLDRQCIIEVLKDFNVNILKLELKGKQYIIWTGGIDKLLYQKNQTQINESLSNKFMNRDVKFTLR